MKNVTKITLFAVLILAFASCGKGQATPTDVAPSDTPVVTDTPTPTAPMEFTSKITTITEPLNRLNHGVRMYYGTRDGITYWFDAAIAAEDREKYVENIEHILHRICPDRSADREFNIYICSEAEYNETVIENDTLYTYYSPFDQADFTAKLLFLMYGEFANYGITSSYADYIEAELAGEKFSAPEFKWNESNELSILDLNLLCHRTEFVAADEVEYVKNIARAFVGSYIEKNGEAALRELISMSGDPDKVDSFCKVLSDYYRQNGIEYTPSSIIYAFGGVCYDYLVKTKFATIYLDKTWKINWDGFKKGDNSEYDDFLHKDYLNTKKYYETTREEMRQYQEFFAFDNYDNNLKILCTNNGKGTFYMVDYHIIYLERIDGLSHEYVHSLSLRDTDLLERETYTKWAIEGFAQYFMSKYNYYGNSINNEFAREYEAKRDTDTVKKYVDANGRDMDMNIESDWIDYCYLYSLYLGDYDIVKNPYIDGASFIAYMIGKFGEKETIAMIYPVNKITGDVRTELLEEWKEYLLTNYSQYSVK